MSQHASQASEQSARSGAIKSAHIDRYHDSDRDRKASFCYHNCGGKMASFKIERLPDPSGSSFHPLDHDDRADVPTDKLVDDAVNLFTLLMQDG